MIKHAEIYKIKIENEIEDESFSSPTFEETAKHVLKDCVISNYFDMAEMEEWWKNGFMNVVILWK